MSVGWSTRRTSGWGVKEYVAGKASSPTKVSAKPTPLPDNQRQVQVQVQVQVQDQVQVQVQVEDAEHQALLRRVSLLEG